MQILTVSDEYYRVSHKTNYGIFPAGNNLFQGRMGPSLAGNRVSESRLVISIGNQPIICKILELSLVSRLVNWGRIARALNRLYESTAVRARIC